MSITFRLSRWTAINVTFDEPNHLSELNKLFFQSQVRKVLVFSRFLTVGVITQYNRQETIGIAISSLET